MVVSQSRPRKLFHFLTLSTGVCLPLWAVAAGSLTSGNLRCSCPQQRPASFKTQPGNFAGLWAAKDVLPRAVLLLTIVEILYCAPEHARRVIGALVLAAIKHLHHRSLVAFIIWFAPPLVDDASLDKLCVRKTVGLRYHWIQTLWTRFHQQRISTIEIMKFIFVVFFRKQRKLIRFAKPSFTQRLHLDQVPIVCVYKGLRNYLIFQMKHHR